MRLSTLPFLALLLTALPACSASPPPEDELDRAEDALTAGQFDATLGPGGRVDLDETFLGNHATKLFFLGRDAEGTYVARRTTKLNLDGAYGTGGKIYVGGPSPKTDDRIAAGAVLADGRVVVTGSRAGVDGYVLNGIRVTETKLVVGLVAADGAAKSVRVEEGLPLQGSCNGPVDRAVPAAGGTAALVLDDGSVAIGASSTCHGTNRSAGRVYRFTITGPLDLAFDRTFFQGDVLGYYGATTTRGAMAVTALLQGRDGSILVGDRTGGLFMPSDGRSKLTTRYEVARASDVDPTTTTPPLGSKRYIGAMHRYYVAAPAALEDGSFVTAGYDEARACVALERSSTVPTNDVVFGAPVLPRTCISARGVAKVVGIAAHGAGRIFVVTQGYADGKFFTRVHGVDPGGAPLAGFGANGVVDLAAETAPVRAFTVGNFLYVAFEAEAGDVPHLRRMKL